MPATGYARLGDLDAVRALEELAGLYARVYSEAPYDGGPKYSRAAFLTRTRGQLARPGFTLITARDAGTLIGFGFGFQMGPHGWWAGATEPPAGILRAAKFAVVELLVEDSRRGHGVGRTLLDRLLDGRDEELATLAARPDSAAHAMYLRWGWKRAGHFTAGSPASEVLVLPLPRRG